MKLKSKIGMSVIFICSLAVGPAMAATMLVTWEETGDAGKLPATAQVPVGSGSLNFISGSLDPDNGDIVDMFKIYLNEGTFYATTVGYADWDTQMFLFNSSGLGVTGNDDSQGTFQSTIKLNLANPGFYYLAITNWPVTPCDKDGNPIFDGNWTPTSFPVAMWTSWGSQVDPPFTIYLEDVDFPVPEPATLLLLGAGLAGLRLAAQRKKN